MKKSMILARSVDNVIGVGDLIPWHCPADMSLFRQLTLNKIIIMGANTWDSLPIKPLQHRLNIVVTSDSQRGQGAHVVAPSLEAAIAHAESLNVSYHEMVFIGGATIYKQVVDHVDEVHISEMNLVVGTDHPESVVFDHDFVYTQLPDQEQSDWELVTRQPIYSGDDGKELFDYVHLKRK